jgi:hypothetical protein
VIIGLTACDGGIFGTSDGSAADIIIPTDGSSGVGNTEAMPGATDSQDTAGSATDGSTGTTAGGTTDGSTTDGAQIPGASTDGSTAVSEDTISFGSFDNTVNSTGQNVALLTIVNVSHHDLIVANENSAQALTDEAVIASGTSSAHVAVPMDEFILEVRAASAMDGQAESTLAFMSMTLSSGSLTTLVVRDHGDGVDIVPLQSDMSTGGAGLARVRVVQGAALNNADTVATLSLQSADPNPGGAEAIFNDLSFDIAASTYRDLPAGDYALHDSAGRFSPQAITLIDGVVYTLILQGLADPVLHVEQDSEIE